MKRLTKELLATKAELSTNFAARYDDLSTAIDTYNTVANDAWASVQEAIEAYNEVVDSANAWRGEAESAISEYVDGKSEKWQEGERGEAYNTWKESYDTEFEKVEFEKPDELDMSNITDNAELINQLSEELEG